MKHLPHSLALIALLGMLSTLATDRLDLPAPAAAITASPDNPFHWLVGSWSGEGLGGKVEETWMPMRGGTMLGAFRLSVDDRPAIYELVTISKRGDDFEMRLKHFNADLSGWEEKDECLVWEVEAMAENHVRFGPAAYNLEPDGSLRVFVDIEREGKSETEELLFKKQGSLASPSEKTKH